jgi:lysozyme
MPQAPTVEAASAPGTAPGATETTTQTEVVGVDVSQFQGELDWQSVKASGVAFAFARALEGETILDSDFAANWEGMKAAGVARGAYHFYVADDPPEDQARVFSGLVTLEPGDLVPMVDIEQASIGASAPSDLVSNFHRYLDLLEQQFGVRPIIYTEPAFWNEHMDDSFGTYPLWVADYSVDSPVLPQGWDNWVLWQHSHSGTVPGVDGSVALSRFAAGLEWLLAGYSVPEPAVPVVQVDNINNSGQCGGNIGNVNLLMAGSFTTGGDVYALTSAMTRLFNSSGAEVAVAYSLYTDDGGFPGALLEVIGMTPPLPVNQFSDIPVLSSSQSTLDSNTTYWVVFSLDGAGSYLDLQGSQDASESSPASWTIGDAFARSSDTGQTWVYTDCSPKLRIDATIAAVVLKSSRGDA